MIREFKVWKIQVSVDNVHKHLPLLYEKFPFLLDWQSSWYMIGTTLVFHDKVPTDDCYLIVETTSGDLAVFRAKENERDGFLTPIDLEPMTIFEVAK